MVGYHISMKEIRKCLLWKASGKDINFPLGFKKFVFLNPRMPLHYSQFCVAYGSVLFKSDWFIDSLAQIARNLIWAQGCTRGS